MAEKAAQDAAAKKRIISHMNGDHHDSIVRYLQHYAKLSAWKAYDGTLQDISLNSLTLTCRGKPTIIAINPPMQSYREARERVVDLDRTCRKALGQSDVTVTTYVPPTVNTLYTAEFLVISATFLAYSQRWWFAPGQVVSRLLGSSFAAFSHTIQPWLLAGLFLVHGAEMLYFAVKKLPKHSVNPRGRVFWLWTISTFIEGQFAFRRFDEAVQRKREKDRH